MRRARNALLAAALLLGLSAPALAQLTLDLDLSPGDQGKRETQVKPGEMVTLELVALKGAMGIIGFEIELNFDGKQLEFKGYNAGGLMAGAVPITKKKDGSVTISAALLGRTSTGESGPLGQLLFGLAKDLGPETKIALVRGSYGSSTGTNSFPLSEGVKLVGPGAVAKTKVAPAPEPSKQKGPAGPKVKAPPGPKQKGPAGPKVKAPPGPKQKGPAGPKVKAPGKKKGVAELASKPGEPGVPPDCSDELRESELKPQQENVPCGGASGNLIFRTVCTNPPYDTQAIVLPKGRVAGCFGVEAATPGKAAWGIRVEGGMNIYHSLMGPERLASLKLRSRNPSRSGKYVVYLDKVRSDAGARVTVRFVDHPEGGQKTTGPKPVPPKRMGQPVGPPHAVGPGAPGRPGPPGPPPDPEDVIKSLPSALQRSFKSTLDNERQTHLVHMKADLAMMESVLKTLEATKAYLPKASVKEKEQIAEALMFFAHRGPEGPPHGGPQMGAAPRMPKSESAEGLVGRLIEETRREMERVKKEISQAGAM